MGIVTRTGDHGTTGLMYNRRISKADPRVAAYGSIDELNSALGMARALTADPAVSEPLLATQRDLVALMGELATLPEDQERYTQDGYARLTPAHTARLDELAQQLEAGGVSYRGWATPGASVPGAALDVARAVCRRAERDVCMLHDAGLLPNPEVLVYLNRLSDTLWLLARAIDPPPPAMPP